MKNLPELRQQPIYEEVDSLKDRRNIRGNKEAKTVVEEVFRK